MDAPIGEILEITEIGSSGFVADKNWKLKFLSNTPTGWKSGHQIRLSDAQALGSKVGFSKGISETRVLVQNLSLKGTAPITVFYDGAINMQKSGQLSSGNELSLVKNIRLDRELQIIKTFPDDVIQVTGGTKWQLSRLSEKGRSWVWDGGDSVELTKGAALSDRIVKIINKSKDNHTLSATFISEE